MIEIPRDETHPSDVTSVAVRPYLPPYSPDLNPTEQAFSKLKAHLRKTGRTFTDLFVALESICNLFTPQEWWKLQGYWKCLRLKQKCFSAVLYRS